MAPHRANTATKPSDVVDLEILNPGFGTQIIYVYMENFVVTEYLSGGQPCTYLLDDWL